MNMAATGWLQGKKRRDTGAHWDSKVKDKLEEKREGDGREERKLREGREKG